MTLEPQMTFDPQMTLAPLTFDPQITLVANGEVLPQITLLAPMPFSCTLPVLVLNDAEGDAADPEGMVVSLYAAHISSIPAPMVNMSEFTVYAALVGVVTRIIEVAGKPRHAVRINFAFT
jgi:hypothetical protein